MGKRMNRGANLSLLSAAVAFGTIALWPGAARSVSVGAQIQLGTDTPDPALVEGARALRSATPTSSLKNNARFDFLKRYAVKRALNDVRDDLRQALQSRGMIVLSTASITELVQDAHAPAGHPADTYTGGEVLLFCNLELLGEALRENPHTIVFCPFSIAVYVLAAQPDTVHVAFRRTLAPSGTPHLKAALARVEEMLEEIVAESAG